MVTAAFGSCRGREQQDEKIGSDFLVLGATTRDSGTARFWLELGQNLIGDHVGGPPLSPLSGWVEKDGIRPDANRSLIATSVPAVS